MQALEAKLQAAESKALMGGGATSPLAPGEHEKMRTDAAVQRLERSSAALERAKAVVAETEEIGVDITGTLAENREKIESAHDKVRTANQEINKAEKITTRMGKWWARW